MSAKNYKCIRLVAVAAVVFL